MRFWGRRKEAPKPDSGPQGKREGEKEKDFAFYCILFTPFFSFLPALWMIRVSQVDWLQSLEDKIETIAEEVLEGKGSTTFFVSSLLSMVSAHFTNK